MRLAVFTPLPPAPSGIADYSQALLPHLAAHAQHMRARPSFRTLYEREGLEEWA